MGEDPNQCGQLAPLDHPRVREQPAPARHRPHRPLPDPPPRPDDRHRRDARRARPTSCTQGKVRYLGSSTFPASRDRRGAVGGRAPRPRAVRLRAAAVLDPRPRASRPTCCRPAQRYGMGVIPWSPLAGGWLSGKWRKGADDLDQPPGRAASRSLRPVACPGNQAQARRRRRARRSSPTRPGITPDPPGARVRAQPPGGHRRRSSARARWSSSRASSARPTSTLDRRRPRPHRRDRPARHQLQPGRRRLRAAGHRRPHRPSTLSPPPFEAVGLIDGQSMFR